MIGARRETRGDADVKALVTGATGFVGSHLVERLLQDDVDVACLARRTSDRVWIRDLPVTTHVATLDQADALAAAMEGVDTVFHVAGLTRARTREAYLAVNADGTRRLIEAVRAAGRTLRRFVYVSSLAAAGPAPGPEPLNETDPPHPIDGYGESKLAAERIVQAAAGDMPITIIRPPAVYGPRDTNFLPLFRTASRFRTVPLIGRKTSRISFVHVTDLVDGIALAAADPAGEGQTYFIASGTHSQSDLADAVAGALGVSLRRLRVPSLLARLAGELGQLKWALTGKPQILSRRKINDALQPRWTCCWDKARRDLGYRERTGLADGMKQTAEWYIQQGWITPT